MADAPVFTATPNVGVANFNTANTARDGSGTINTVLTPGTAGTKLNRIVVKAEADLADSVIILWLRVGGTVWFLWKEIDAADPPAASTTVAGYEYELNLADRDIVLPLGCLLGATITVAPTTGDVNVFAFGGNF
jgi:hypothetical protein